MKASDWTQAQWLTILINGNMLSQLPKFQTTKTSSKEIHSRNKREKKSRI